MVGPYGASHWVRRHVRGRTAAYIMMSRSVCAIQVLCVCVPAASREWLGRGFPNRRPLARPSQRGREGTAGSPGRWAAGQLPGPPRLRAQQSRRRVPCGELQALAARPLAPSAPGLRVASGPRSRPPWHCPAIAPRSGLPTGLSSAEARAAAPYSRRRAPAIVENHHTHTIA